MPRASTTIDRNGLKTALKQLVALLGGIEAAAACTRVQKSQLSDYGAVPAEERHVPVDVVLDLERVAGLPLITAALARAQGYRLVSVEEPDQSDVAAALQVVASDAGATLAEALRALGGRTTDPAELRALQCDLSELVRAGSHALGIVNLKLGLERQHADGG